MRRARWKNIFEDIIRITWMNYYALVQFVIIWNCKTYYHMRNVPMVLTGNSPGMKGGRPMVNGFAMVDILARVLPNLPNLGEDEPLSLEEALMAVQQLVREGVTDIVAAADFQPSSALSPACTLSRCELERRVRAFTHLTQSAGCPVRLYAAHVLRLEYGVEEMLVRNIAATINDSPYVLLDLAPSRKPPERMQRLPAHLPEQIQRLRVLGFVPVLIHVERYGAIQRNPNLLLPLIEAGALLQVTLASLDGTFGIEAQRTAYILLQRNLAHVLASEAPAPDEPYVRLGLHIAEQLIGRRRLYELVHDVPEAIIFSAPVEPPPPIITPSRGYQHARQWHALP